MRISHGISRPSVQRSATIAVVIMGSALVIIMQIRWMNRQKSEFGESPLSRYTSIIDAQTHRVFCDNCEGSGFTRDPNNPENVTVCPVCFGLGMHQIRQISNDDLVCPTCRGLGRISEGAFDEAETCPRCEGRGMITRHRERFKIQAQKVICEHCDGRGTLRDTDNPSKLELCPLCFGLGSHLVRKVDGHDELCPRCGGMGRLVDEDTGVGRSCPRCEGRGLIVTDYDVVHPEHQAEPTVATR